jgi:hypothetical protein
MSKGLGRRVLNMKLSDTDYFSDIYQPVEGDGDAAIDDSPALSPGF